jgi:hypothetical protein
MTMTTLQARITAELHQAADAARQLADRNREQLVAADPASRLADHSQAGPADDPDRWREASMMRGRRPGWVVIWSARKAEFQARPLFTVRPNLLAAAPSIAALEAAMEAMEKRHRRTAGRPGPARSANQQARRRA